MTLLPDYFGVGEYTCSSIIWLTILLAIPPVLQTLWLLIVVQLWHDPPTCNCKRVEETEHSISGTKDEFIKMTRNLLVHKFPDKSRLPAGHKKYHAGHKHHAKIKTWLLIDKINANIYCQDDKNNNNNPIWIETIDGRDVERLEFDGGAYISEAVKEVLEDPEAVGCLQSLKKFIKYRSEKTHLTPSCHDEDY